MFETTRRNLGLFFARTFLFNRKTKQINFSKIFTKASSALVIIPENPEERKTALSFLSQMQMKFNGNRLTIIISDSVKDVPTTVARSKVIVVEKDHRNFFFLPNHREVKELLSRKFDCIVDLNTTLEPVAAYLCKGVDAPLKVGFAKEHGDVFYNFQINITQPRNVALRYEQMFKTLSMF